MPLTNQGGKRARAGRKPGPKVPLATTPSPLALNLVDDPDNDLRRLGAVRLAAQGWRADKILKIMPGIARSALTYWMGQPRWIADVETAQSELLDSPREMLRPHIPQAIRTVIETMDSDRPAVRLQAADSLLDRALGKAIVKTQTDTRAVHYVVIEDARDDD